MKKTSKLPKKIPDAPLINYDNFAEWFNSKYKRNADNTGWELIEENL